MKSWAVKWAPRLQNNMNIPPAFIAITTSLLKMTSEKQSTKISRFLSLVLRHQPQAIGIELDENGWTDVQTLIEKANSAGFQLDRSILKHIVETNTKKRFAFSETGDKIRASQGHSVDIALGY